jgi:hypothetical protein
VESGIGSAVRADSELIDAIGETELCGKEVELGIKEKLEMVY